MAKRFFAFERAEWRFWLLWVLAGAVGWALALAAIGAGSGAGSGLLCLGVPGSVVLYSAVQWLILSKHVQRSGWWVLASTVGGAVAVAGLLAVAGLVLVTAWTGASTGRSLGAVETVLYVAFVCHDPDIGRLRASLTDRDRIYGDDFVGIVLDTYRDQQRAYEFFSNPHGVQGDMLWHAQRAENDDGAIWQAHGGEDPSFDAVWESAGRIYDDHWVVEMRIPLSALRYPSQAEQDWGVHFVRVYPRDDRYQFSWMPISQVGLKVGQIRAFLEMGGSGPVSSP